MAVDYVAQFNALGGKTGVTSNDTSHAQNVARAPVAPKAPSFLGSVGNTLSKLPAQAGGALLHATIDPFAHLIGNAANAFNANKNAADAQAASDALDKQSKQAKSDFQAGRINRQQYIAQLHGVTQAAQGNADTVKGQQVKSISQMAPDALSAIGTVATLGSGALEQGAAKAGVEALGGVAGKTAAKIAGTAGKVVDDTIGAGKGMGNNVITQLPGKIVRNAVVTQPTVQMATQTTHDISTGNTKAAAGDAAMLAAPGALGLAANGVKAIAPAIRDAALGKSATLTDAFGVKPVQDFLAANANNPDAINKLKRIEMFTENQPAVKSGYKTGGQQLADHLQNDLHVDPKTTPLDQIVNHADQYFSNQERLNSAKNVESSVFKPGTPGVIPQNAVISHDFTQAVKPLAQEFRALGDQAVTPQDAQNLTNETINRLGITNESVKMKIAGALQGATTGHELAQAVESIPQKVIIKTPKGLLDKGYVATHGPNEQAALPSIQEAKDAGMPVVGADAHGPLAAVAKGLDKVGAGLTSTSPSTTSKAISASLDNRLAGTQFEGRAKDIMSALNDATSKTRGVFDPRLLRATTAGLVPGAVNIEHELGVTPADAKMILKAVKGAYGDVPLGTRSLGEKLTDKMIQHLPPMASYLKAQGYGRFTANPIFWAKQATKAEYIAQADTGGKSLNMGRMLNTMLGSAPKSDTMKELSSAGYLSKGNAAGGEADFFGNLSHDLGSKVSAPQVSGYIQQSMGQAAEQFAKNNGTTVGELLSKTDEHPLKPEFDHLMQMIVGYPKGQNVLNTNLAKTLNVLVFPSRFETKVGMATAKYFMAQPKVVQLALVNGALKANAWAGSPEGKQWQKDNADVIGLFNYFSPTHTLDAIANFGKSGNLGDLGAIGGMPLGVVTTILKNQGVPLPNAVSGNDINPKTGSAYVQHLPATDKARVQQGITDLVGSMFSYPGATVGLPSKGSTIGNYVPELKIDPKEQTVVSGGASATPVATSSTPVSTASNPSHTIPQAHPKVVPVYKGNATKPPKPKVHAIRPANSKI